ncbi:histone H4-like TAF Taf6, SAGA complex subunit [Savitreella phatthalungensis]
MSVYNADSVRDAAEALGIPNFSQDVAQVVAQDVEYRLHAIILEAQKFMRHSKRTTMRTADIDHALRVLNVEPLYGFAANNPVQWHEAPLAPGQPPLYYVEDEEIEFEKIINAPLPKVPRDVSYTAHWLAIEGVQPAIPQNPTPAHDFTQKHSGSGDLPEPEVKPLIKHALSKELLLYFERITKAVLDQENDVLRSAAIASLRHDPGLHQLLPYFVQYIAEKVTHNLNDLFVLDMVMQMASALLDNRNIFIEPYVHQLVPSILTCVVAKRLGSQGSDASRLRNFAASILGSMCDRFGQTYTTLKPRVTKTLLKAYLDNKKPFTTHYGAIVGLTQLGTEVVRILVLPNAKVYELILRPALSDDKPGTTRAEAERCFEALKRAVASIKDSDELPQGLPDPLDGKSDEQIRNILESRLGKLLGDHVMSQKDDAMLRILLST